MKLATPSTIRALSAADPCRRREAARDPAAARFSTAAHAHRERGRVAEALRGARGEDGRPDGELVARASRLARCCQAGHIAAPVARPEGARWCAYHCDDALCTSCHEHRTQETRDRLRRRAESAELARSDREAAGRPRGSELRQGCRMFTLTVASRPARSDELTGELVPAESARACYRRTMEAATELSVGAPWLAHVHGALISYEATWSRAAWHGHVHVLAEGRHWDVERGCRPEAYGPYLEDDDPRAARWERPHRGGPESLPDGTRRRRPLRGRVAPCSQRLAPGEAGDSPYARRSLEATCLRCAWFAATGGDAWIVHATRARGGGDLVGELCKYIVKPGSLGPAQVVDWARGMRRAKTRRWIGAWRDPYPGDEEIGPAELEVALSSAELDRLAAWGGPLEVEIATNAGEPPILATLRPEWARAVAAALEAGLLRLEAAASRRKVRLEEAGARRLARRRRKSLQRLEADIRRELARGADG